MVIYWYILILKHFHFLSCITLLLSTSSEDLTDYKPSHILAVKQRCSAARWSPSLSRRFRGFIRVWKNSDPRRNYPHCQDPEAPMAPYCPYPQPRTPILGVTSPCPSNTIGCWPPAPHTSVHPSPGPHRARPTQRTKWWPGLGPCLCPGRHPAPWLGRWDGRWLPGPQGDSPWPTSRRTPSSHATPCGTASSWASVCN